MHTDTGWCCRYGTWQEEVTVSGHCLWPTTGQYLPRTLFGTYHVRGKEGTVFLTSGEEKLSYGIFSLVLYSAHIMLEVKSVQFISHPGKKVKLQHYFSFSFSISFYSARIMLGVRVHSFPFIRVGKLSYSILILRFQAKMLEYSHVGLAFMWYVFYFKFPPLKTFTRKTLQLSSEGIIVKRGNSCEKIVPSRCLSSLDSKMLVIVWQPSWMGFNQMFKKTDYAFVARSKDMLRAVCFVSSCELFWYASPKKILLRYIGNKLFALSCSTWRFPTWQGRKLTNELGHNTCELLTVRFAVKIRLRRACALSSKLERTRGV